jgi:hypothetical protein
VKLAYIICAHKLPDQLVRLVRRLDSATSTFFIHLDRGARAQARTRLAGALGDKSNVHFLEPHRVAWGGFGQVRAALKGISTILATEVEAEYCVLLSGQDYPIKPIPEFEAFLERSRSRSFIMAFPLPTPYWPRGGLDRLRYWHFELAGRRVLRLPIRRRLTLGMRPYGGDAYWCLSRDHLEVVRTVIAERPDLLRFFRHAFVSDELFFQTVLMNSVAPSELVNDSLRYIDWGPEGTRRGPRILGSADLEELRESSAFFARKFDTSEDARILDLIDAELLL